MSMSCLRMRSSSRSSGPSYTRPTMTEKDDWSAPSLRGSAGGAADCAVALVFGADWGSWGIKLFCRTCSVPRDSGQFSALPSTPPAAACWAKLFRAYGARMSATYAITPTQLQLCQELRCSLARDDKLKISLCLCGDDLYLPSIILCPGASYSCDRLAASRASTMVASATARAFVEPCSRMSHASLGFASYFFRSSWMGASSSHNLSAYQPLHSMQPIPAVRQPSFTLAMVSAVLKILCRSPTGQRSGLPGSVRRMRAGSVTIVFSFWRKEASGSLNRMVLPYDFDILRPSEIGRAHV